MLSLQNPVPTELVHIVKEMLSQLEAAQVNTEHKESEKKRGIVLRSKLHVKKKSLPCESYTNALLAEPMLRPSFRRVRVHFTRALSYQ